MCVALSLLWRIAQLRLSPRHAWDTRIVVSQSVNSQYVKLRSRCSRSLRTLDDVLCCFNKLSITTEFFFYYLIHVNWTTLAREKLWLAASIPDLSPSFGGLSWLLDPKLGMWTNHIYDSVLQYPIIGGAWVFYRKLPYTSQFFLSYCAVLPTDLFTEWDCGKSLLSVRLLIAPTAPIIGKFKV